MGNTASHEPPSKRKTLEIVVIQRVALSPQNAQLGHRLPQRGSTWPNWPYFGPTGAQVGANAPFNLMCPSLVGHLGTCCPKVGPSWAVTKCCGHVGSKRSIWTILGRYAKCANNQSRTLWRLALFENAPPSSRCTSLRSVPSLAAKVPRRGTFGVGRFHRQSVSILKTWGTLRWI